MNDPAQRTMDEDLTTWDTGANDYLAVASDNDEFKEFVDDPAFMDLLGDVTGKRILDIGCGDGTLVKKLRAKGATVTGIDGSPQMIASAEAKDPDGDYQVASVMDDALPFDNHTFDIVTAKMMLMNVGSLKTVATNVRRILKPDGLFAVDVVHPFRPLLKSMTETEGRYKALADYFHEVRGDIEFGGKEFVFYYRPVSQYVNEITAAGFTLLRMEELGVDKAFAEKYPKHIKKVNQPVALHLLFRN